MTSDGDALFRAVCENPADDTPRLVYADWLEENGRVERAEFIRLQCEAWNLCPAYPTVTAARERASQLSKQFGGAWHGELPHVTRVTWSDLFVRGFVDAAWVRGDPDSRSRRRGRQAVRAAISLTEALDRAFSATPLRRVTADSLTPVQVAELLAHPLLGRLAKLRLLGVSSVGAHQALMAEARRRCPQTEID